MAQRPPRLRWRSAAKPLNEIKVPIVGSRQVVSTVVRKDEFNAPVDFAHLSASHGVRALRILVTGGAGFIGSNLARKLIEINHDVIVLDDFSSGLRSNVADLREVKIVEGSVCDPNTVQQVARGVEAIVHLAARGSVPRSIADPVATHNANTTGTLNVLEAARTQDCYVVMASSSSVFGANALQPKIERTWTHPLSPYAASKLAGEGYVLSYKASFGFPALILRFFNVFGPWQRPDHAYAAVIPRWISRVMRNEPVEIHGDGKQTRDFTYVDTVVDALIQSVESQVSPDGPINVAFGQPYNLLEVLHQIEDLLGRQADCVFTDPRRGDVRDSLNNPDVFRQVFPTVEPVEFRQALARTVAWLQSSSHR